jgi:hypothetical protein
MYLECYGIRPLPDNVDTWMCQRCLTDDKKSVVSGFFLSGMSVHGPALSEVTPQSCVLCPHTGGAFKRIKPGHGWIHVVCSVWISDVEIADIDRIEDIDIRKVAQERWNAVCAGSSVL